MKFTLTKIAAALALTVAATGAHAVPVTSITLGDTLTLTGAVGSDGFSGSFKFNSLNAQNSAGASQFTPVNGGVISTTAASPSNSFTTGFMYAGSAFRPNTTGPVAADITGGVLTYSSLPWGGYYEGAAFQFNMTPDAAPATTLVSLGGDNYAFRSKFNHVITSADDPSGGFVGFNAFWIVEGTMSTAAAPVPEASTYGMMLAGLGLVGVAIRRRRNVI